jgi:8-oxo-dGTP diphosphatase
MIPRYGDTPQNGQAYRRRPGVYAILLRGDRILVTHQASPQPEFQLPGGGIDPGEQPLPALYREVREETGWGIADPRRIGAFRRFAYMPEYDLWAEKLCAIYVARPTRPFGPPTEPGHRAIWLPVIDALTLLGNPGDRQILRRVVARLYPV